MLADSRFNPASSSARSAAGTSTPGGGTGRTSATQAATQMRKMERARMAPRIILPDSATLRRSMGTLKAGPPDVASIAELAQSSAVRECLQWVVREKQWINEQHLQVCRIAAPTFL